MTTKAIERKLKDCLYLATWRCKARGWPMPECTVGSLLLRWYRQDGLCKLSGLPLELKGPNGATLDRINPTKPYTRRNIQIVSLWANIAKSDMTTAEFRELCRSVLRHTKAGTGK